MNREYSFKREMWSFAVILLAAVLLFWWRAWIPSEADRMYFTDDILVKDYPTRLALYRSLLEGHFPLWDPSQFGGWPGIANCEAGFFYPFNWIIIPFVYSPQIAFQATQWLVLLHFVIAGLGAYCLARSTGLTPVGAAMASVAFTFCGFHCAHKKHTNMFFTLVWLPWILWQVEIWVRQRMSLSLVYMILLLALAYLAGHPQASLYMTLVIAARIIHVAVKESDSEPIDFMRMLRRSLPLFLVVGVACALSAVQWIPLWELIRESERSGADVFQRSTEFSLPPFELIDAIFPEALRGWSHVEVFYWGGIPLLLLFLVLIKTPLDSFGRYLCAVAILSILLSLGEYLFVYDLSYVLIPGVAWVRAPSRWIYFASLPIALLAGRGVDLLVRHPQELAREKNRTFFHLAIVWFVAMAVISLYVLPNVESAMRMQMMQAMLIQVIFSGTFLLCLFLYQNRRMSPQGVALLAISLTWLDLGTQYRTLDMQPGVGGYAVDENVETIHQARWNQRTKVFLGAGGIRDEYHGAAQGFNEVDGQSPLTPVIHLNLRQDTAIILPEKPNYALFDMLGIGAILSDQGVLAKPFNKVDDLLFINEKIPPPARVYTDFFYAVPAVQRRLLALQSFPYDRVLLVTQKQEIEKEIDPNRIRLFPKPFLLASASIDAVTPAAYLVVDGVNHFDKLEEEPGYYLAVADPETGKIEETEVFSLIKTWDAPQHLELQRMRDFVEAIPTGKTVFATVRDSGADLIFAEGLGILRAIGASVDVRRGYRWAHAIIGQKDAPIGSAIEIFSPTEALVLQTEESIVAQGIVADRLHIEGTHATTLQAAEWYDLLTAVNEVPNKPIEYALSYEERKKPSLYPKVPITILSIPKKSGQNAVLQAGEDRASILIRGEEYSLNRVGYNLVVMNPLTNEVVAQDAFNLLQDLKQVYDPVREIYEYVIADPPEENVRMQEFLQAVPNGYFVLGAIRDEATDLIRQETIDALRLVGSDIIIDITDADKRKRFSHAFMGIKGSPECIEAYRQETDAIVFNRYLGSPVLTGREIQDDRLREMINPMDEVINSASAPQFGLSAPMAETWSVESRGPNELIMTGYTSGGGILFVNEIFYSGWQAYVDGLPQPIQQVNYYFRGVHVPPGKHVVRMRYEPMGFTVGMYISVLALIGIICWWAWARSLEQLRYTRLQA